MINRDKVMTELVATFDEALAKEKASRHPQGDYPHGSLHEVGLHAAMDVLERDYIVVERDTDG
jgi:hypothetical protein